MSDADFAFPPLEPSGGLVLAPGTTPHVRAAEIVETARAEASALSARAEAEGFERGRADGLAQAETELAEVRAALAAAAEGLAAERDAAAARLEERAVELALLLAGKIVAAQLEVEPARVLGVVQGALRRLAERDRVVVEVDPDDHALVRDSIEAVLESVGGVREVEVLADRRVGRGGCIVRTAEAEIDARVAEQLAVAGEVLRDVLAGGARA